MNYSHEQIERQKKIRNFFIKWKDILSISGFMRKMNCDSERPLDNFINYRPTRNELGFTPASEEHLQVARKMLNDLRNDIDKAITEIDNGII